jgi:16S rRNA (adenine(1408)-N(1))-methyltransferase
MAKASRRAAASPAKGGLPNAMFVLSAVESLPFELDGTADEVRIHFPWGSLLRGLVEGRDDVLRPAARLCGPGATLLALWSVTERDLGADIAPLSSPALASALLRHGFEPLEMRDATVDEIVASRSSWAKRIGAGAIRRVTLLRAVRR